MQTVRIDFDKSFNEIPRYLDDLKGFVNNAVGGIANGLGNLNIHSDINEGKDAVEIIMELAGVKKRTCIYLLMTNTGWLLREKRNDQAILRIMQCYESNQKQVSSNGCLI